MKRSILILPFMLLCIHTNHAQTLKLNAGVSLSAMDVTKFSAFDHTLSKPFVSAGLDYCDHRYWYLSLS